MKTTIKIKFFAITILMASMVAGNIVEANAQTRNSRNSKKGERKENSLKQKSYRWNDHHRNDRRIRAYSEIRRYGDTREKGTYRKFSRRDNEWKKHGTPNYYRHYDSRHGYAKRRDFYYHPNYGRTYRRFHSDPFVFRYKHGRYYYYNGYFCDYRPGIGYVIIDIPYLTVFTELPFRCKRIGFHGNVYYQYGNLYFEALPYGYRLVPSPFRINISATF
jgi:Ni/Co efflux regulator RcnB